MSMSNRNRISVELDKDVAKMLRKATKNKKRGVTTDIVNVSLRDFLQLNGGALPWSGGRIAVQKNFAAK